MLYCILLTLVFWQQRVDYRINVKLDVKTRLLSGTEFFKYYNNAPVSLDTIYFHLYPNAFKNAHSTFGRETEFLPGKSFREAGVNTRGYIMVNGVGTDSANAAFRVDTTILAVILDQSLDPGDSLMLTIDFELKMPEIYFRLGYQGDHYEFVQWYPKICVFDQKGWHLDTYHALGEFYGEYGDFDVRIRLPADYVVAATGVEKPRRDDDSLSVLEEKQKTVRFAAENVHDFAWVCDPDFLIDDFEVDGIAIKVYFRKKNRRKWRNAEEYAVEAVSRFNRWFGEYPYPELRIVEGMSAMGSMEYPMLVIINELDDPLTRLSELCIAHEIAHQWFYGVLGFNEMDEAWLDEGLASYAENRYFEDRYGKYGSLFKSAYLPSISKRYYNMVVYYMTRTNGQEKSILDPAYKFTEEPLAYLNGAYSKPALFLTNLESYMGRDNFDKAIQTLYKRHKFGHPKTGDLIGIFEEISSSDLDSIFHYFLHTSEYCDWDIETVTGNEVTIINNGKWLMPTEVMIQTRNGGQMFYIDGTKRRQTFCVAPEIGSIRRVTIDPNNNCIDFNRWNNHYPARVSIKPYIQFPSFDAYQILIVPYPWYGIDDGVTLNLYLFGAGFIDYDFLKGQHQWLAGFTYGTKSGHFSNSLNYQTPLVFTKNWRMRVKLNGSQNWWKENVNVGLNHNIGVAFTERPRFEINNNVDYFMLDALAAVDSIDWELGRVVTFNNQIKYLNDHDEVILNVSISHRYMGSDYDYLKASFAVKKEFGTIIPFALRLFGGYLLGDAPPQDNFFLSGALRITVIPDLVFGPRGYFSPQEHIHIPGDGNMRGYQTMHIKSNRMAAANIEFPSRSFLRAFADIGWYNQWAWDVGVRLVLGPVSFNVPLYIKDGGWRVHWSIGF